ncbi:MAG: hypothetical protein IIB56_18735 [Planctomycetes bacterium]|nr:hypothetical protein [Planctomycetota bacterium]
MEDNLFTSPNSIIYHNSVNPRIQIESDSATVTYTDVQGGWPGEGGPPLEKKQISSTFIATLNVL